MRGDVMRRYTQRKRACRRRRARRSRHTRKARSGESRCRYGAKRSEAPRVAASRCASRCSLAYAVSLRGHARRVCCRSLLPPAVTRYVVHEAKMLMFPRHMPTAPFRRATCRCRVLHDSELNFLAMLRRQKPRLRLQCVPRMQVAVRARPTRVVCAVAR